MKHSHVIQFYSEHPKANTLLGTEKKSSFSTPSYWWGVGGEDQISALSSSLMKTDYSLVKQVKLHKRRDI